MEIYAGKKICAKNLLKEAAVALSCGKERPDVSSHTEELALLQETKKTQLPGMTVREAVKACWRTTGRS